MAWYLVLRKTNLYGYRTLLLESTDIKKKKKILLQKLDEYKHIKRLFLPIFWRSIRRKHNRATQYVHVHMQIIPVPSHCQRNNSHCIICIVKMQSLGQLGIHGTKSSQPGKWMDAKLSPYSASFDRHSQYWDQNIATAGHLS